MSLHYYMSLGGERQKLQLNVDNNNVIATDGALGAGCGDVSSAAQAVSLSVIGGKAPYTFAWTNITTAREGPFTISNPTGSVNIFWSDLRCAAYTPDNDEVWRATVTDDNGDTATVDVNVSLEWINFT